MQLRLYNSSHPTSIPIPVHFDGVLAIDCAIVFSNEQQVFKERVSTYMPVYYCMFLANTAPSAPVILLEMEAV